MEPTNSSNGSRSPEVSEKAQRRRFTGEYKRSIVDQYDGLGRGEQGALLRREGLYSSHIDAWRKQREAGVLSGLATKRRGPKPKAQPAVDRENAELRRKVARLERKLKQAETIIEIQKSWAGPEGSGGLRRRRERLMAAVDAHRELVGVKPLCDALAVSRETYYRRTRPAKTHPARPRSRPPRALSDSERAEVLELLCSERFVDRSPVEMYATLLDEGIYHCSLRTMYRVLKASHAVRERRDQLRHPNYKKPELIATAPNQVWSWDITKLLGPEKWSYFYLYVVLDIFSRYVVGWMLARSESAELAKRLLRESCEKHNIAPGELVVHSDRGAPMTSKTLGQLLADLGVEKSLSRPHVSNDNPFSESHFKTLKYSPGFPDRFAGGFEHALAHCRHFFPWYNDEHHHGGLVGLTPAQVHFGRAQAVLSEREHVLRGAYERHPERFVRGLPRVTPLPSAVWINPPTKACERDSLTHDHSQNS